MEQFTTCPNCNAPITVRQLVKLPTPFHFKCRKCKVKLRVLGFTYISIILSAAVGVLLAMIAGEIKEWIAEKFPLFLALPTVFVFGLLVYPIMYGFVYLNALYIVKWGDITVRD